ncbi:hypothetical protein H5410_026196 [Solanum commersonii]|uniref:Uncharacterized protein n=1 Tax=Solanum commersonii TaxID=4109 RepID=A0A9J5YY26_SOLCO|nr:hypothetical protein H5410_026196 [Solanum commersonii]
MAPTGPEIFGDTGFQKFLPKLFMDVQYNLVNDVKWSRGPIRRIFKFKRAQIRKTMILSILMSYSP